MDVKRAQKLLLAERAEVEGLLKDLKRAGAEDREAEAVEGDRVDRAQPLTQEYDDASVADQLTDRLAAIDRALARIKDGTYGLSVRSGLPIPDKRLAADPAAELTVDEARAGR
jgi:DnaK suppressor protein